MRLVAIPTLRVYGWASWPGRPLVRLFSFISADKLRTYCLYEAPSPDAIFEAARRANVPADKIVEVTQFEPAQLR